MMPALLLLIASLAFLLVRLAPGGPFDRDRKPASPEIERQIKAKYHLDESIGKQYVRFLGGLAHGDFGASLKYRNHSVSEVILQGFPVSLSLGTFAFGFALGLGIPIGYYSALKRGRLADYTGSLLAVLMVCIPAFVVAPLLIMILGLRWGLLPVALWGSAAQAILPTIALGLFFAGRIARLMREGMLGTMQAEFITAARARGLTENQIVLKHALRLAILPVVSESGPMLADLLTGSFVIESLFQLPGLGTFLVNGSLNRDYTLVVGLVVLYATLLVGLNLLVDFLYAMLDRRVRYE